NETSPLRQWFQPPDSPHEAYLQKLQQAELDSSSLGQKWIQAAEQSLQDSIPIELPFLARGYFSSDKPRALTYRFEGQRGEILKIEVTVMGERQPELFFDLFQQGYRPNSPFERVASADSGSLTFEYHINRDRQYMLRIQPGLLQSLSYEIKIHTNASLAFPVEGKDSGAIRSFWGDRRDGGKRSHKGVDIFAAKGTPALAAIDGYVSRVKEGGLGGKVVWLRDGSRSQSLYYAHLDTQMVRQGQYVKKGDTLGLVGKTGNARTTPPHLHFGIYQSNVGAVNPFPFIHAQDSTFQPLGQDTVWITQWMRTREANVSFFQTNQLRSKAINQLLQHTPIQVISMTHQWAEVLTSQHQRGWIQARYLEPAEEEIDLLTLARGTRIKDFAGNNAGTLFEFSDENQVSVLAQSEDYYFIRTNKGLQGWINRGS
ncbi:MAG: peptidoglycan DD-metalloendopeptidase family protein, partial [Bacteroidetes bacterium]|nr:peptidoglycan DD-metalloendopeptidase family protein [Bacteroidota bacterium]